MANQQTHEVGSILAPLSTKPHNDVWLSIHAMALQPKSGLGLLY
jgi:hypothetical protein